MLCLLLVFGATGNIRMDIDDRKAHANRGEPQQKYQISSFWMHYSVWHETDVSGGRCPKNSGTGIQFTWGLADERKTEPYKEFSTGFKNRKLSTLKVKFCAWTFLFFRSVFYLRSYLYYIRYFLACHLFMLTGSNLQVIVKKFHKINILVHMQWLIRIKN